MTAQTNSTKPAAREPNKPGFIVKMRDGRGRKASYDRIGVAWQNEDGSLYVKLHGRQIVERGFTLYPLEPAAEAGA